MQKPVPAELQKPNPEKLAINSKNKVKVIFYSVPNNVAADEQSNSFGDPPDIRVHGQRDEGIPKHHREGEERRAKGERPRKHR